MQRVPHTTDEMYESTLCNTTRKFYHFQVTGAAFMLMRTLGKIPLPVDADATMIAAQELLKSIQTFGGIVADQMGLGKTIQTLLFLNYFMKYRPKDDSSCKPVLLAVPANLVQQWAEEIRAHWPDFNLVISFEASNLPATFDQQVISSRAVKALPNTANLPQRFRYLTDATSELAGNTIWLTSIESHAARVVKVNKTTIPAIRHDPPQFDEQGKEIFEAEAYDEEEFVTRMERFFCMSIVDEAHTCKTASTRNWAGIYLLKFCKYKWLITATPMINRSTVSTDSYLKVLLINMLHRTSLGCFCFCGRHQRKFLARVRKPLPF